MAYLERWFGYCLLLVLFFAAPSCMKNATTSVIAPQVFPKEATNGTIIITCKTSDSFNTSNETLCLNTTGTTNTAVEQIDNLTDPNATVTFNNSTNEAIETTTETADINMTTNENVSITDTSTDANNTDINKNETVVSNNPKTMNETKTDVKENDSQSPAANATLEVTGLTGATNESNNNSNKIDTEVPDLLTSNRIPPSQPESPTTVYNGSQPVDKETETVDDGKSTEDDSRDPRLNENKSSLPGVPLVQGQLAAILAGVFVAISVIAYLGLLSWRRYLENRYGNRQMLINEDEFNDDLKHFSI